MRFFCFYLIVCFLLWFFEPNLLFPRWAIENDQEVDVQSRWVEFHLDEDPQAGKIHGIVFVPTLNKDWKDAKATLEVSENERLPSA